MREGKEKAPKEEDGKSSKEEEEEEAPAKELPMEEAFKASFLCATLVGLHLVSRKKKEEEEEEAEKEEEEEHPYTMNRRALIPMALCSLIVVTNLITVVVFIASHHPPFWFLAMQIPYAFDCVFCVFVYAQSLRHTRRMIAYMTALRRLRVHETLWAPFLIVGSVSYVLVLGACTLFLSANWYFLTAVPSVMIIYYVPSVLDLYMLTFLMGLKACVAKLAKSVRERRSWSEGDVDEVGRDWLLLKGMLSTHNEIFNLTVHLRLMLLVLQSMSYFFIMWGMMKWSGECKIVLMLTGLPSLEVMLRLRFLCTLGEEVISAGEELLAAVREAAYNVSLAKPQHQMLTFLTARMEAAPTTVHNWGMDSLSARTFVSLMSAVTTYALVLVQFCSKSNWSFTGGDRQHCLTRYDSCFNASSSSS